MKPGVVSDGAGPSIVASYDCINRSTSTTFPRTRNKQNKWVF